MIQEFDWRKKKADLSYRYTKNSLYRPCLKYLKVRSFLQFLRQSLQPLKQVVPQVFPVLKPNTDPTQPGVGRTVAHGPPFDQRLHAAEGCGVTEQLQLTRQSPGKTLALHDEGEDGPEPTGHLLLDPTLRTLLNTRMLDLRDHRFDVVVFLPHQRPRQPPNQTLRIGALSPDPHLQRPQTPHAQPPLQTAHDTPQKHPLRPQPIRPPGLPGRQHSPQHIAVAPKVLGATVHHNIGALLVAIQERVLQARRSERRVDQEQSTLPPRDLLISANVLRGPERIQRSLEVDDIARSQLVVRLPQADHFGAGELDMQVQHPVAPVVPTSDRDFSGVQEDVACVQRRQA